MSSNAGLRFNKKNLELVMLMLEMKDMAGSRIKLSELLQAQLNHLLPRLLNYEKDDGGSPERSTWFTLEMCTDEEQGDLQDRYFHSGTLRMDSGGKLAMRTRLFFSEFGELITDDARFDPIVNIYDVPKEATKRIIEVQCPGVNGHAMTFEEAANGINVFIRKDKTISESDVQKVFPIRQQSGEWSRAFTFPESDGSFVPEPSFFSHELGILTITLIKKVKPNRWTLKDCFDENRLDDSSSVHSRVDSTALSSASGSTHQSTATCSAVLT